MRGERLSVCGEFDDAGRQLGRLLEADHVSDIGHDLVGGMGDGTVRAFAFDRAGG